MVKAKIATKVLFFQLFLPIATTLMVKAKIATNLLFFKMLIDNILH